MSRELMVIAGLSFGFALFLTLFLLWVQGIRDAVPKYKRGLPAVRYGKDTIECLQTSYRAAGSIEGTLLLASRKCQQKRARRRFRAAVSYLKESRYQDYETALLVYASDSSKDCNKLFTYLIELEVQKTHGLPVRRSEKEHYEET